MDRDRDFAAVALPHLDAAFNLARWLTGSVAEAEDVVQEALVRALTYFPGYRGGSARAWLLKIVRNAAYAALNKRREEPEPLWDEDGGSAEPADPADDPEAALIRTRAASRLGALLERLPAELKETLVLRELEEMSYRDIAEVTGAPVGTVMSRLWRARRLLAKAAGSGP
jgi:RNA polymerase sigma-70 factor, ECF subfamily